jgi:4-amino-4-deoxy-L-arabinose transferase-like glycosyltransferase
LIFDRSPAFHHRAGIWAIVLIGVLLRGVLIVRAASLGVLDDSDNYLPLARSLAEGRGFWFDGHPTAYRPPLYPLLLAPCVAMLGDRWGVGLLHLALGAGTILLTASAARRWGLSKPRVWLAAAIVALDPVLVAQSRAVMSETLAAFLTSATLAALAIPGRKGTILGGIAFGLSALCRPSAWPSVGFAAALALGLPPGSLRERVSRAFFLIVIAALTALPWAIRNALVLGEPIFTTTHGGYTLFLANNPVYYDEVLDGPPGAVWTGANQWRWWDSVNRSMRGLPEPEADRATRKAALRFIASRPRDFARASLARLGRFWGLAPTGAVYPPAVRLAAAAWTAPLWLALALGLLSRETWRWPRASATAIVLGLTVVHAVFWTDQRMRAPALPAIALVASAAGWPVFKRPADRPETLADSRQHGLEKN